MKDARHPGGQLWKRDKGVNQFIKSKITPLFMSLATLINKFISTLAKIQLKEIKDVKIESRKKSENWWQFIGQFDNVRSESAQVVLIIIYNDFKQWMCLNICKTQKLGAKICI